MKVGLRQRESDKKPTRYYSSKQEKTVANKFNGRTIKKSGATLFAKGDAKLGNSFLAECKTKTTDSDSISIKKEWLEKIRSEALFMGKDFYTLAFNFGPGQDNYYIIDENTFEILFNYLDSQK